MLVEASSKLACNRLTSGKWGWSGNVRDIENTVILTKNGTPLHMRDIAVISQRPEKSGWASSGVRFTGKMESSSITAT